MRVSTDVLAVLDRATFAGNTLSLAALGQLDRKLYEATDKVLRAAGGKWSRTKRVHHFDRDAAESIEPILLSGEVASRKQEFQQFDTPEDLARLVMARAALAEGLEVLEPSAGVGSLVAAAVGAHCHLTCVEIDEDRFHHLRDLVGAVGIRSLVLTDFLTMPPAPYYDRVVMNPPFTRDQDIAHVRHAAQFLKPGGRLVAIMSSGITYRIRGAAPAFREWVANLGGTIEPLPDNAFAESGTNVSTVLVVLDMPGGGA